MIYRPVPWNRHLPELEKIDRRIFELYASGKPDRSELRRLALAHQHLRTLQCKIDLADPINWALFGAGCAALGLCFFLLSIV
jgi:hypothetical protein